MANIFSIISIGCFIFAGICFLTAIALFFALNTKAAYMELKGQPQSGWIVTENKTKKKKQDEISEVPTSKRDIEDEAVTVLDNGEEVTMVSLMNVYEPGTEIMEDETTTEVQTFYMEEEATTALQDQETENCFIVTKRKIFVHSDEILR